MADLDANVGVVAPRVVLVEDDVDLRELLAHCLSSQGLAVTTAGSGLELYQQIAKEPADIVILDIGLPDQDGYAIASFLRANTNMGLIILTARSRVDDRLKGFTSGADLYFVKPVDCRELAIAATNLARRLAAGPDVNDLPSLQASSSSEPWVLDNARWSVLSPRGLPVRLTAKEFDLVVALTQDPGRAVDRTALLEMLDYANTVQGSRGLDALVSRLRRKIEAAVGEAFPIQTVHAKGYLFSAPIKQL
ncbi:two component transcriptional regulator [Nitrospirillum viridazoti Y2]|uniref:Winged helix family two component transcriptional regulator n=1 Tax=Nitrospirillum amazonense TaxID=28077 RepID=A0A560HKR8_9PROT|nr:response regulator transcription factor [Nitrospirillum amazonense]EGY00783.1 two component transcriptional regulator [Nitrospirillum amazonense Y2]TWB47108.1 winged helix family two component transcriptional regulator [Nitrospirillum amazonense]